MEPEQTMESKESKWKIVLLVGVFTLLGFSSGVVVGQLPNSPLTLTSQSMPTEAKDEFASFWEVWNLVHERYYDLPVDDTLLAQGAIEGMLNSLEDPFTRYLSPEDEAISREQMEGEFEGIGAHVTEEDGAVTIISPIDGSPAEAAGLRPGDIMREADGVELTGMPLDEAAALVRGPKGTAVNLLIERDGETFEIEIVRDAITVPSVAGELREDNIAYVRITQFGENTAQDLEDLLEELMADNPDGMIVDLRRNPGGSLSTVLDIADEFLDEGLIMLEEFGDGEQTNFEARTGDGLAETVPMVVLIDEGSASASEVLAGAIQDRERGILIGTQSFGKGTVQSWQGLSNGGGVRLTIARWLTPNGRWVHQDGLTPDYNIPLPDPADVEEGAEFPDTQLEAAVDYLQGEEVISIQIEE